MATRRLIQLESFAPFKKLISSFKPGGLASSSAIMLVENDPGYSYNKTNRICMVTKTKKIDWGGQTVFPGGLTSTKADGRLVNYVQQYYSLYIKKYNFNFDDLLYRINALRELFEETGILLYRNINDINPDTNKNDIIYPISAKMYSFNSDNDIAINWRNKVLSDPYNFEMLYRSLDCVPDILSLVPWMRLQTPWRIGRRWDARFYLALISKNEINHNLINPLGNEISSINWINIDEIESDEMKKLKLLFPPPTMMQLNELDNICNIDDKLMYEYNNAYYHRNVKVIRPKLAFDVINKKIIILWNRDYLYDKLFLSAIECNDEYEKNEQYIQRIYIKGKRNMDLVCSFDRMYEDKNIHIPSKL